MEDRILLERKRPRITVATGVTVDAYTHSNHSSLGPLTVRHEIISYHLDNGERGEFESFVEMTDAGKLDLNAGALAGSTVDEAWDWVRTQAKRDAHAESAAVRILGDGNSVSVLAARRSGCIRNTTPTRGPLD